MKNIFTEHPNSVNETYFQHFIFAFMFGINMLLGGIFCIIHAVFPFLFQKTGSHFLLKMTTTFIERMPFLEERVIALAKLIDKKREQTSDQNCNRTPKNKLALTEEKKTSTLEH